RVLFNTSIPKKEESMDYGKMLSRAWQLTWQHKVLWIFGILAALVSAGNWGSSTRTSTSRSGTAVPPEIQQLFARPEFIALVVAGVAILLCIALALIVLATIGRAALIGGIQRADERGAVTLREAWSIGTHYFWRLLGIALVLIAPAVVFIMVAVLGAVATFGLGLLLIIPLACVGALAYIPFAIVAHFAQYAVVLNDMGVGVALRKAWAVLQANLGPTLILGVLLIVIRFVARILVMAPFLAFIAPVAIAYVIGGWRLDVF